MIHTPEKESVGKKHHKVNLENSPDSEKYEKCVEDLTKHIKENVNQDSELLKFFMFFSDISKKTKYQIKIIETSIIMQKIKELLQKPNSNPDITMECAKIILNLGKNRNCQSKLIQENVITFNDLFEILLINMNTSLTLYLLSTLSYLTENNELLDLVYEAQKNEHNSKKNTMKDDEVFTNNQISHILSKVDLMTITRTLVEKILDDLNSNNKKTLLKVINNMYTYSKAFITKEAIEPIIRCLGNKNNDVVISSLKLLLFFTRDKVFHSDLMSANFIFRLVRTYKQGIDEMDMVIVKILYDLFENKGLYEILFENNVLLILSNYLTNFEVEKNEKYEEVIRNVFEIFKLINKNTDEDAGKNYHPTQNPLLEEETLQLLIFKKAYSLAAFSKSEKSILSCLSVLQMMLIKFSNSLLNTNDSVKSIIELVPPFFKNKNLDIIKYSLSIFELIIEKKSPYFQDTYVQSTNQTFSIKSLVHSIINLINELSGNNELLSMSCRILVNLSDIPKLQPHFLQEPQITVIKIFNDTLLRHNKEQRKERDILMNKMNYNSNNNTQPSPININEASSNKKKQNQLTSASALINANVNIMSKVKLMPPNSTNSTNIKFLQKGTIGISKEEKEKMKLQEIEKRLQEDTVLIKDALSIISNLSKNVDNLEILTMKGFLDVITEKLNDNDTETLPYVVKCIQGFCQGQSSIEIILKIQIISKILTTYKLYKEEDIKQNELISKGNMTGKDKAKGQAYATMTNRVEVLQSLKNILESDIKLQRTFIIEKGIEILLSDVSGDPTNVMESTLDQLNEMILRVIYVVSCNINKLFLIYFSNDDDIMQNSIEESDSECISGSEGSRGSLNSSRKMMNKELKKKRTKQSHSFDESKNDNINSSDIDNDDDEDNDHSGNGNGSRSQSQSNNYSGNQAKSFENSDYSREEKQKNLLKIFTSQLSEKKFMAKLIEVGEFEINTLSTYKELIKILINLYLNRYYLKYFTMSRVFDKVITIIGNIMKKYKENVSNDNKYEILKLVIIFLKFICEDEALIKKFLMVDVISVLISTVTPTEFSKGIKEEELEQFYYNFSLVLLRLTEFTGHVEKFKSFPDFFQTLERLYDINLMNGKIYIISIIRNIIAEKQDFFNEDDLSRFLNKIVTQSNTFIIYEFVELIKNLVHNRSMCKRMENVFKYLINEIKSNIYSPSFKKKMLDLILCLSYENTNIRDYALHDLLSLVKNLDVNINQKTTLLILMNFSSISSNFSYLMQKNEGEDNGVGDGLGGGGGVGVGVGGDNVVNQIDGMTIKKQDFINVINHLIDSDRFSQILIQRLLINITSIEGIDMSIISDKIMKVLIEILQKCKTLQENIIVFSLATLVNVSNRNILKLHKNIESLTEKESLDGYEEQESEQQKIGNSNSNANNGNANKKKEKRDKDKPIETDKDKEEEGNDNNTQSNGFFNPNTQSDNKEIIIVDYILERLPNITEILTLLFSKDNLDISALSIMFACNLLRKIKFSKYYDSEAKIAQCVEDYVKKESKISNDLLNTDSGKFLLISIIKYCICLSIENKPNKAEYPQYKLLSDIVMSLFKDTPTSLKQFKLTFTDIAENTINFACVENQLNFFNMILSISKEKDMKYFFTFDSYDQLRNSIGSFFIKFITEYSELLIHLPTEENSKVKLELNPSFQNVLVNILKMLTEYVAQIQIINEPNTNIHINTEAGANCIGNSNSNMTKAIRKKINADFYKKIGSPFQKLLLSIIQYKPSVLNTEFKSLIIYVLFIIFSNKLGGAEFEDNIELEKWLIKLFMLNNNSIQNDFFCLKVFTISIHSEKFPDIFFQSTKFIKKLISYLKYTESDQKKMILQRESERILNIISFNQNSHSILYSMGIYNHFKTNLFVKTATVNQTCQKEDFILLVNMILNKDNKEYIQDDIKGLLQCIFPCKDLANNLRVDLFDVFMSYTVEVPNEKKYHEDYLVIFNLLYENLKESFSEMIFLFDKFTKTYKNFTKKFLSEDSIVIKIFYDFLQYDKNFPSKAEELNCYLKILELFCEVGEISDKIEAMVNEMMGYFAKDEVKNNLRDINILNAILNFSFLFFVKYCEKRSIDEVNLDNSVVSGGGNTGVGGTGNAGIGGCNKKKDNTLEDKLEEFIKKFYYNKLIDTVIENSISNKEINGLYVLTMLLIQDDFKNMLFPLKALNSLLFKKEFLMSFFKLFFDLNKIDIKEFVFVIHIAIIVSNVGSSKLPFADEFASQLIEVYEKYIFKSNSALLQDENSLADVVTSVYFFCDFIKTNELNSALLTKTIKFLIKTIQTVKLNSEQKEILIRYYQEILLHFRINTNEDLNMNLVFFNKIHSDKEICLFENLVFGTLLINTRRDVLLKNLNEFLNVITVITIEPQFDKKKMINFFKFNKQICLCIVNSGTSAGGNTIGEQAKQCLNALNNYINNSVMKYQTQIKEDKDLNKKYEKIKGMIANQKQ